MGRAKFDILLLLYAFVYIGPLLSTSSDDHQLCHPSCFCLDTFFDCRKRGLATFPDNFPSWVQKLNLSNNEISRIEGTQASRLHALKALNLDANNFTSFPSFGVMPQLLHLSLARNNITKIESHLLTSLISIQELDLSKNKIEAFSNSSFPFGLPIRTLNLGFNFIEVLLPRWFDPLSELVDLNIAKNKLKTLSKETFIQLKNLERLDLSRNKLEMVESLRFQELKNLTLLNLRRNHMTNLSDAAFYGLEKIQHLYLDGNNIKFVEKRWLYGLRSLISLNLSKNEIGKVDDDSWEFMEELQILDISSNKLEFISTRTLMGLSKLRFLDLSFNQISAIEKDSFLTMGNLEVLDLSNNDLSWVLEDMPNTFKGAGVHSVNLAHNKIRSLHPDALRGLPNLLTLNLTSNPIKWLSEKAFQDLPYTSLILWDIETLVCDCHSLWLRSRLTQPTLKGKSRHRDFDRRGAKKSNTNNKSVGSLTCAYPVALKNQHLVDVPVDNLTCSDNSMRPQFLEEPETEIFLMEGNGSLSCRVQSFADLPLSLVWKIDRKDLPTDRKESQVSNMHRLEENGATTISSTLKLANVSWNHKGSYQCVAENSLGVVYTANANVTVHVFPTFIKKPSNVTVRLGYNAKLECAAKGFPYPEIAFHKVGGEDFPAALDRRFHVMPNDDSFFIMEVKLIDMGVYCCSARNAAGEIKIPVRRGTDYSLSDIMEELIRLKHNAISFAKLESLIKEKYPEFVSTISDVHNGCKTTVNTRPWFVKIGKIVGRKAHFWSIDETKKGLPLLSRETEVPPVIFNIIKNSQKFGILDNPFGLSWYFFELDKYGKEIEDDKDAGKACTIRVRLTDTPGKFRSFVSWFSKENTDNNDNLYAFNFGTTESRYVTSGHTYNMIAVETRMNQESKGDCVFVGACAGPRELMNEYDDYSAYATVTVYETPSFSDAMEDESAVEGNNAILSCLANGSPKPQLTWTKEGVAITDGKEKRFHLTENGSLLLIKDVQLSDAGRYECLLSNAVGTTRGFSILSVLPNTGGRTLHLDPSAMTIIFIIIFVFCVVGTSAVWVVVIYRTRKRNKPVEPRKCYEDDGNIPGFSGNAVVPFTSNCQIVAKALCHDSDSQSSSAKDSGTGDDIPETDPMGLDPEQASLMGRSRHNKQELESFSTFGTRASSTRMLDARNSQVRLDLQNELGDVVDVITLCKNARRVTKVSVPVPPEKELTAERRSTCPSNSSSSGYSSSGTRNYPRKVGHSNKERSDSVNSEELVSLQDHVSVEEVTCISTPV